MKVLVVTNMYPSSQQPAFGTFVQDQVEALRQVGVEVDVLFIDGRKHRLSYLWGIFRFWGVLLKKRYHLIHAHHAITGFIARLQFLHPVVVTYHGGEVGAHVPGWLRSLALKGPRLFDRVVVVNQKEKVRLRNRLNVRVIPCGVDLDEFQPMPQAEARCLLNLPLDKPLVLWAGEYWQFEKRFELVRESVQVLKKSCPQAELILVSGKPHSEIPAYMNACDVLLLTSCSEGSPMVIKEAMACNMPIVSTNVGDVAEIIQGVQGCYLAKPTAQDIAEKLRYVFRQRLRTNGRDRIAHLSSLAVAHQIVEIYNEVCREMSRS